MFFLAHGQFLVLILRIGFSCVKSFIEFFKFNSQGLHFISLSHGQGCEKGFKLKVALVSLILFLL